MMRLPGRYDKTWFIILAGMFFFTLALLLIFKLILGPEISVRDVMAYAILAAIVSLVTAAGGYLGFKVYFGILTISDVFALLYMLYIAGAQQAPGWTELVGIISYMFIMGIGMLGSIVVEALVRLAGRYRTR